MPDPARPPPSAAFAAAEPVEPTAASLLQGANAARSRGQIEQAASLLRELQQRFPGSPEATLSHVSLGKLLMLRGSSEAALREFSTYLTRGGPLEEEALVGRAQALGAMGRLGEERGTWEALLTRFPNSVYAPRARERLGVLAGNAAR
jgi:outer membrane protein assembly factor BamD (BamD/ComL family)